MKVHIIVTDNDGKTYEGTADLMQTKNKSKTKTVVKPTLKPAKDNRPVGPADAIRELYNQEFFVTERSRQAVIKKLSTKGFNFDAFMISDALTRAKYLMRRGTLGNYSFIQKRPPS